VEAAEGKKEESCSRGIREAGAPRQSTTVCLMSFAGDRGVADRRERGRGLTEGRVRMEITRAGRSLLVGA